MAAVQTDPNNQEWDEWTKPPFLRRVRIRGYKSIAFCDVELKPLTILVGRNASGKSNFIDALAFLKDVMNSGVIEAIKIRPRTGWPSLVCRTKDTPKIEIETETYFTYGRPSRLMGDDIGPSAIGQVRAGPSPDLTGEAFKATYSLEISIGPHSVPVIGRESLEIADGDGPLEGGFEVHNGIISRWGTTTNSSEPLGLPPAVKLFSIQRPDFPLLSVIGTQPFIELGEALRWMRFYNFIPDTMRALSSPTGGQLLDKHGQNLASVVEGLKELEPESVQRVRDYLTVISEEIEDFDVAHLGEYETVRFRMRGGAGQRKLEFDAASMSDGTLRSLAALMAVFQVVLPRGYPSVVGIEEPETALHPGAMRALVDALDEATGRTQVLLTTHSAEMLDNPTIRPENIRVVQMVDGRTVIGPVDEASVEIVRRKLNTLGGLERDNQLEPDLVDRDRQQRLAQAR